MQQWTIEDFDGHSWEVFFMDMSKFPTGQTTEEKLPITKGFVQLGHDVEAIIGSANPSFGFGGRNSVGQ